MRAYVLATGPSLTREQVEAVRARGLVIAVSNAYTLAPWADALVSTDAAWWNYHTEALEFRGRRVSANVVAGVEQFPDVDKCINSGLLAIMLAVSCGATTVVALGIDMQGSHFFGDHPLPLVNSNAGTFEAMKRGFAAYQPEGVSIVNCSPASALDCYPKGRLEDWV